MEEAAKKPVYSLVVVVGLPHDRTDLHEEAVAELTEFMRDFFIRKGIEQDFKEPLTNLKLMRFEEPQPILLADACLIEDKEFLCVGAYTTMNDIEPFCYQFIERSSPFAELGGIE